MQLSDVPAWDVAATITYAILRVYAGADYASVIVAALAFICSLDRDMCIHEFIQAFYMVRYSCGTIQVGGSVACILCVCTVCMSLWAQTERYQQQGHIVRRASVGVATFAAVLVRYDWNGNAFFSVCRLVAYTVTTRISVFDYDMDSWDAAIQSMWLLVVPAYAYALVLVQIVAKYYKQGLCQMRQRWPTDACLV